MGYIGRRLAGYQIKVVAEYFNRDPAVLSKGVTKVEQKIKEENSFAIMISRIERELIGNKRRKIFK